MSRRTRARLDGRGPLVIVFTVLLAIVAAPFAVAAGEGKSMTLGARNPSNNESQALTRETEIIANTSTYGTRQSNKSDNGGGAIYGCRSKQGGSAAKNEPCIRSNNLADGLAFEFETDGPVVGSIRAKDANAKPFTTNATGVADGLNADRVDSKSADEIASDGAKAAVGAVQTGLKVARVGADGSTTAETRRGVTSTVRDGAGRYTVTFDADIRACALQATQVVATDAEFDAPGSTAVRVTGERTVRVATDDDAGAAADRAFHLQATCL
ncbi:hypothetical protein [Conexibacter sp. SYSU D00693]|uniref:hypothetical protein n=1 Tax=Conexibacter sp. SYSU D00693 TaxID=2812560 RepID=UPI00196AF9B6|nr:hypothetical protein [Conexibacter sp. SYSU D00693]